MANKAFWMVRAGESAFLFQDFKNNGIIAIGWHEIGDLSKISNKNELKDLLKAAYPKQREGNIAISAGQVGRFRFEFKIGDNVISYNPQERRYLIGEIVGEYEYAQLIPDFPNVRKVKWLGEIDRDKLSTKSKLSLGSISTIFEVGKDVKEEIMDFLQCKTAPDEEIERTDIDDQYKEDMIEKAHELIKDKVVNLDWEDMQRLVAGILRSMGYKTRISPRGADRGKDIEASTDGLGLVEPMIYVEVKHRIGQMGAPEIRSFSGGLRDRKGLYVSTGGFTKEAKYEADRSEKALTLIDLDALVDLIVQYYESFDSETKALIPLSKIFWPE